MRAIGLAGWSGAGKTTLITRLIPEFARRGLSVSTVKHAHHGFDIDRPGKDSWRHREAGAEETVIAAPGRIALLRELRGKTEPSLATLLTMLAPVDLVLIEGYRRDPIVKIEIFRAANGKPALYPDDPWIAALASDGAPAGGLRHAGIDDIPAVAALVLALAEPVATVIGRIGG